MSVLRDGDKAALDDAARITSDLWRDMVRFFVRLLPAAIRFGCVVVCAVGVVYGTYDAWAAFGGDGAALIPAFALGLIPLLFAFVNGVHYGGILAAGAFTYFVAQGLQLLPALLVQIAIVIVLATLTYIDMGRRGAFEEGTNEHTEN